MSRFVTKHSRLLVVDACVLRSASTSPDATGTGRHCRDLLRAIYEICHRAAFNDSLLKEWRKHESRFARLWRTQMASRKKLVRVDSASRFKLLESTLGSCRTPGQRDSIAKDWHVVELALDTEQTVFTSDTTLVAALSVAGTASKDLLQISWIDPCSERPDWLTVPNSTSMRRNAKRARPSRRETKAHRPR